MVQEAEQHLAQDAIRRELVTLRNQAHTLIHSTESSLKEYAHMISPLDVAEIQADLATLKGCLSTQDPEELMLATQNLEQSAYRISDAMYADAAERKSKG